MGACARGWRVGERVGHLVRLGLSWRLGRGFVILVVRRPGDANLLHVTDTAQEALPFSKLHRLLLSACRVG